MQVTSRIYIQREIGRGGYGIVYKAEFGSDKVENLKLCIKMVNLSLKNNISKMASVI